MSSRRILAGIFFLCGISAAHADGHVISPARARAALQAGHIKPLATLLAAVEARYAGEVIEAELREEGKFWFYEFELLPENGRIFQIVLDARTGIVIRTEGPVQEKR